MLLASADKNKSPGIPSSNALLVQLLRTSSTALIRLTLSKCSPLGKVYAEHTYAVFNFQVAPFRLPESVDSTKQALCTNVGYKSPTCDYRYAGYACCLPSDEII